jgi:hypothetical protein
VTENPESGRDYVGGDIVTGRSNVVNVFTPEIQALAEADPGDVQAIAASQLKLLTGFYEIALDQARKSFRWAIVGSIVGVAFFVAAVAFVLGSGDRNAALVSAIGGGVVEVIAGINFVLYGKTTAQLLGFHARLEQTQRFLLANSICQAIDDESARTATRSSLVATIAGQDAVPPTAPQ